MESNPNEYDIIVVGGGFGGPVAAKKCADAGLKTLMIERSEEIGEKVISGLTIPFYGFLFGPAFIRDGNPPIERPVDGIINYIIKDIDQNDIDIDDTLKIPKPLAPVVAFGYNAYCKPFCQWEADQAVAAGAELRTAVTVVDVTRENGCVCGVQTETGETIRAKVVINSEGSQGLLAIKAGVREKYPPDTISLADIYDYEMDKDLIDRVFGYSVRFCWGWDEQKIAPPLGHGNGLMVWPYRNSIHFMQDQCLRDDQGPVYNLKKMLDEFHGNMTARLPWWRDDVAPHIKMRARMWEGFEIFVGLNPRLRAMPNITGGMMLIGDAAGLENTELCDGVPTAWFSADIAADVAIAAVQAGDTSEAFLRQYSDRINRHPLIQWAITATSRYNLRYAQQEHDEKKLKKTIHAGWGLGAFGHASTPLLKLALGMVRDDPAIIGSWVRMYLRYYFNWHHQCFGDERIGAGLRSPRTSGAGQWQLQKPLDAMDTWIRRLSPLIRLAARMALPLADAANPLMRLLLPVVEPVYLKLLKRLEPALNARGKVFVQAVASADPAVLSQQRTKIPN